METVKIDGIEISVEKLEALGWTRLVKPEEDNNVNTLGMRKTQAVCLQESGTVTFWQ